MNLIDKNEVFGNEEGCLEDLRLTGRHIAVKCDGVETRKEWYAVAEDMSRAFFKEWYQIKANSKY